MKIHVLYRPPDAVIDDPRIIDVDVDDWVEYAPGPDGYWKFRVAPDDGPFIEITVPYARS